MLLGLARTLLQVLASFPGLSPESHNLALVSPPDLLPKDTPTMIMLEYVLVLRPMKVIDKNPKNGK